MTAEERKVYMKAYQAQHAEELRIYQEAYRQRPEAKARERAHKRQPEVMARERERQNRPETRARVKTWTLDNPERFQKAIRKSRLRRKFGITPEDYDAMLASQDGGCAICGVKDPSIGMNTTRRYFSVDHNHETGEVRGLLCGRHNTGIGCFQDDATLLAKASQYLTTPPARKVLKQEI